MLVLNLFNIFYVKEGEVGEKGDRVSERVLSATFADIPAPNWKWEQLPSSVPRLDAAAVQIENVLYVFAGYGTIDYVSLPVFMLKMLDFVCLIDV